MSPTFSLGRIWGVRIGINWSWAIIFGLILWSLGTEVFPVQDPGLGRGTYAAMAFVAALLFFASLLLHELGHAVVARQEGMEIEGITLWLFGGVASFRGEFPSAGAEFRIAVAGPVVTTVIGTAFVVLAAAGHLPTGIDGVALWLGYINFFLLAFNLLPALPLDGGRVLRSALWASRGDFAWATTVATSLARGFAVLMIAGGLLLLAGTGAVGGLWLALIGSFLLTAASSESRSLALRRALTGLKVRNLMIDQPVTADPGQTLREFVDGVAGSARYTAYPVVFAGEVIGVLPLARVLGRPREEWDCTTVGKCMLAPDEVPMLTEDEDALDGLFDLSSGDLHRGLVVDHGRVTGFISITDIARLLDTSRAGPRRHAARPG